MADEPMLSQGINGQEPMLASECAPGGVSQASMFGAPEHMTRFYGVCDWCDGHWWSNPYEAHAWRREELCSPCECGGEIDWYSADEVDGELRRRLAREAREAIELWKIATGFDGEVEI